MAVEETEEVQSPDAAIQPFVELVIAFKSGIERAATQERAPAAAYDLNG